MTDLPTHGGSYVRDPATGALRPAIPTGQEEPPERNELVSDPPAADVTPAADPGPDEAPEPAPAKRRSTTSKGGN